MHILLFGITKELIGGNSLNVEGDNIKNVSELKSFLLNKYPDLQKLSSLAIAVNNQYANEETKLLANDEIALIPPVSGG